MKVPKPDFKPVEIVQDKDKDEDSNDSDWGDGVIVPEKKTEQEVKVVDNMKDGFDPAEVEGYEEFNAKYEHDKNIKKEQLERFKQREKE